MCVDGDNTWSRMQLMLVVFCPCAVGAHLCPVIGSAFLKDRGDIVVTCDSESKYTAYT